MDILLTLRRNLLSATNSKGNKLYEISIFTVYKKYATKKPLEGRNQLEMHKSRSKLPHGCVNEDTPT